MKSISLCLCIALAGACAKSGSSTTAPPVVDPVPMAERREEAAPKTPANHVLAAYERARMLLADDQMTGLADAARAIEKSATSASFPAVASAAAKLATTTEIEAAREQFGEVSRALVAVIANDKTLAKGQHIFECPMVKGYKKWVQPSDEMANPYMGKKMLACGGESSWQ